jgi:ferrochelatase
MTTPIDVLLLQLGTPSAPTTPALRRYLREFLSDPRVIELPSWRRWLLVNLLIVPRRAPRTAEKYRRIWDPRNGSPLLDISRRQANALARALGNTFRVHVAMRYGGPSIRDVTRKLFGVDCRRLVVLPMYPQYSAATTASGLDALFAALARQRVLPAFRVINHFYNDPGYIDAVARSIARTIESAALTPEFSLLSFHGLPLSCVERGDPYREQTETTARMIAERLGWSASQWRLTYQSRFGKEPWLTPYTDEMLKETARAGLKTVLVATPGFTADCLETIDEIGYEGAMDFLSSGGRVLLRVPCVNDDPAFVAALAELVQRESEGWR